jgi:hypothetical protein
MSMPLLVGDDAGRNSPYDWNAEMMSRTCPCAWPGLIVPP